MEVEPVSKVTYKFELVDGGKVEIQDVLIPYFITLGTMLDDVGGDSSSIIPLNVKIRAPIMQIIIDMATVIYLGKQQGYDLEDYIELNRWAENYNNFISLRLREGVPFLFDHVRDEEGNLMEGLDIHIEVASGLNWFDSPRLSIITFDEIKSLLDNMTTDRIETLFVNRKRKRVEGDESKSLPLTLFYRREKLIREYLNQSLPIELVRANRALQKYIDPLISRDGYEKHGKLYFLAADGLYTKTGDTPYQKVAKPPPGTPLSIASGKQHTLCLTTDGLFGLGVEDELLGDKVRLSVVQDSDWLRIKCRGEVLMAKVAGTTSVILTTLVMVVTNSDTGDDAFLHFEGEVRHFSMSSHEIVVLTTTGLYGWGSNNSSMLSIEKGFHALGRLSPIIGIVGEVKSFAVGFEHMMIVTSDGLYACGSNLEGQLGLGKVIKGVTTLTKVVVPSGIPLSVHCGRKSTVVKTTTGLYICGLLRITPDLDTKYLLMEITTLHGDVKSIVALNDTVFVLTTQGLYLHGFSKGITSNLFAYEYGFVKQPFDMGYSSPTTIMIEEGVNKEEEQGPAQKQKLHCVYCHGKATFISHRLENTPMCSKYCVYKSDARNK